MYRKLTALFVFISCSSLFAQNNDSLTIRRFYNEALANGKAYVWLDYLSNQIGGRLSGSKEAAMAVDYVQQQLEIIPANRTFKQPVMVPHWVRGGKEESYVQFNGKKETLSICALGGSIATPKEGINAKIIEVHSFDELAKLNKNQVQGKIIFMNHPMDPEFINTFSAYGEAANYRYSTAGVAAPLGAIGVVVRSMTLALDDYPHTGAMAYPDSVTKIPNCAISTLGAEKLSAALKSDPSATFYFKQNCHFLPDVQSYNVIGELKGSEFPDEIIVVGGHLDSWDLGDGSHDDGAGIVQSMEVLSLFKTLHILPKRTIRFVAFMNEENGAKGGETYAKLAKENKEKNIAAIESDAGGFAPRGFSYVGDSTQIKKFTAWEILFNNYELHQWIPGYGGTDIDPLKDQGTFLMGLLPDSQRYFDVHHAATDTFDKVNRRELELGAAAMASLAWLISEYGLK